MDLNTNCNGNDGSNKTSRLGNQISFEYQIKKNKKIKSFEYF